ncbi:hypothetical protein JYG30_23795 [Fibrella sp. USSR17]
MHQLMSCWIKAWRLLLFLCLATFSVCQAQIGFQVSPAKLFINHSKTASQTVRIHIINPMDTRLVLQATCADWRRDTVGAKVYYPAGTLPGSCCSIVSITPNVIELAPHQETDVLITVRADAAAGTLRNGMILFTQVNEQETARAKAGSLILIKVQIGVHIYVLPGESRQPEIGITNMEVARSGKKAQLTVEIANTGGTLLESNLRLEYLNLATMQELKTDPVPVNTMPKDQFKVSSLIPETLAAGKYLIVAILDSGPGQTLKVAELETVLK